MFSSDIKLFFLIIIRGQGRLSTGNSQCVIIKLLVLFSVAEGGAGPARLSLPPSS